MIFSPVPEENSNQSYQLIETLYVRGGEKQYEHPTPAQLSPNQSKPSSPTQIPEVSGSESKNFYTESGRVVVTPDNGNNPGGSGDDDPDITIGTENWKEWVCPNPDEIISNQEFWNRLQKDPETCLIEDEDDCWDTETESESTSEKTQIRRRLLAVNPNPSAKPTPTAMLDKPVKAQYRFSTNDLQPFKFYSKEGKLLTIKNWELEKIVYAHSDDLDLLNFADKIVCPVQLDPKKYHRTECRAITDVAKKEAFIRILELTTSASPTYLTRKIPMPSCPSQDALVYIDTSTRGCVFFHTDGRLWSAGKLSTLEIIAILNNPYFENLN